MSRGEPRPPAHGDKPCWPAAGRDPGSGALGRRGLPPASPPRAGAPGDTQHLEHGHRPPSPPPRAPSHEGKAVQPASLRQEGRGGLRGMTRDNPGLSPASPAPLDPGGGDTAGTRRGSSPRRRAVVYPMRYPMRQARTCRLHNPRRPHTYPALHKGSCPRRPPRQPRRRAGGQREGEREGPGGGPGRAPR